MVEELRAHMKEMLEVGAIHPSQSPWCNAVMLVSVMTHIMQCIFVHFHNIATTTPCHT